jgi:hypothetical protein
MTDKKSAGYDKETSLIEAVFNTPKGKELLAVWMDFHVLSSIQDVDVNVTHNRLGKRDFVVAILNALGE